jgi:ribulose-5-phosphate 4-epimerase/fuculose-1-phosphate aldolase
MTSTHDARTAAPERVRELVAANRILASQKVLDGFGHVSVRHDADPSRFLIARSMAPALVTASDIVACDLDGTVHDTAGRRSYLERFIHSAIYRARPDVHAIVHSHSPTLIPFGVTGTRLRPVCHMSGFLGGGGAPVFEIRDVVGETSDMLVRNLALGTALARVLSDASVALMRGHGSVVVGSSLKQVVYRAIYAEANAKLQLQASLLGPAVFLSPDEAESAAASNDEHLDRPWALWLREADAPT